MKILLVISSLIFLLALGMKMMHLPMSNEVLLAGTALVLLQGIVNLGLKAKSNLPAAMWNLSYSVWILYLMFRLIFWPYGQIVFLVAIAVTAGALAVHFMKKAKFNAGNIAAILFTAFMVFISFTPAHRIFYFMHLAGGQNEIARTSDYLKWDKYSWFLYLAGEKEQALEANTKALAAFEHCLETGDFYADPLDARNLERHTEFIQKNIWYSYP